MKPRPAPRSRALACLALACLAASPTLLPAATVTAKKADDFVFSTGVNIKMYGRPAYEDATAIKNSITDLGVKNARDGLTSYANSRTIQIGRLNTVAQSGVRFAMVYDPAATGYDTIATYYSDLARMNNVQFAEGPNEPDLTGTGWVTRARDAQTKLWDGRTPAGFTGTVIGPSLARNTNYDDLGNLAGSMNWGNIHSYPGGDNRPESGFLSTWLTNAAQTSGSDPIIATETGYHNATSDNSGQQGVSERAASIYLPRLLLEHFNRGVYRTFLHQLKDEDTTTQIRHNWGLLRRDNTKKPAFIAIDNLITVIGSGGQTGSLNYTVTTTPADFASLLLRNGSGEYRLLLWRKLKVYTPSTETELYPATSTVAIRFDQTVSSVKRFTPTTSTSSQQSWTSPSSVSFALGAEVQVLQIKL
jgi:hypothetical protein